MKKGVSDQSPDLPMENRGAVEHCVVHNPGLANRKQERSHDCANDVNADQHCRDVHWISPHPRHWPVIVRRSDPEHGLTKQPPLCARKVHWTARKKSWRTARTG